MTPSDVKTIEPFSKKCKNWKKLKLKEKVNQIISWLDGWKFYQITTGWNLYHTQWINLTQCNETSGTRMI